MLQPNPTLDPLVEILRLAYRRGLALRQQQAEQSEAVNVRPLDGDTLTAKRKDSHTEKESIHEQV